MIYEPPKGLNIHLAAQYAWDLAADKQTEVEFTFNDIRLFVSPLSNPDDIVTIYGLKCRLARAEAKHGIQY